MQSVCVSEDGHTPSPVAQVPTPWDVENRVREGLPLVDHLVREVQMRVPSHVHRDDLVSAAMLALTTCARSFDAAMGVSFVNYARLRMRGALTDELRAMDWMSRSLRAKARQLATVRGDLGTELGRTPTADDVCSATGLTRTEISEVDHAAARASVVSLQAVSAESGADVVVCDDFGPESLLLRREQFGYLREAVAELPPRQRAVIEHYFFGQRKMSEIAADLGVTESRVSQLRSQALRVLRDRIQAAEADAVAPAVAYAPSTQASQQAAVAARASLVRRLAATTVLAEPRQYALAAAR